MHFLAIFERSGSKKWEKNIVFQKKLYFILIDGIQRLKRDIIDQNRLIFERVINFFARWQ
jgi:hypothetical protein